jgi:carbon monoxide dehydrogenase subunit G
MPEMKPIKFVFDLPGPIEKAWQWLTVEECQKKWMKGLQSLQRDDGGIAYEAGTHWTMVMQEGKKLVTYHASMPVVDAPNRFNLSINADKLAPGGKINVEYRLTKNGDQTRLDYHSQLVADRFGLFLKLFSPLVMMMIRANTKKMFQTMIREMQSA